MAELKTTENISCPSTNLHLQTSFFITAICEMKIMRIKYENWALTDNSCSWNSFVNHTKPYKLANKLVSVYLLLLCCSCCTDRRCCLWLWPWKLETALLCYPCNRSALYFVSSGERVVLLNNHIANVQVCWPKWYLLRAEKNYFKRLYKLTLLWTRTQFSCKQRNECI
jgi:hypothetical protein